MLMDRQRESSLVGGKSLSENLKRFERKKREIGRERSREEEDKQAREDALLLRGAAREQPIAEETVAEAAAPAPAPFVAASAGVAPAETPLVTVPLPPSTPSASPAGRRAASEASSSIFSFAYFSGRRRSPDLRTTCARSRSRTLCCCSGTTSSRCSRTGGGTCSSCQASSDSIRAGGSVAVCQPTVPHPPSAHPQRPDFYLQAAGPDDVHPCATDRQCRHAEGEAGCRAERAARQPTAVPAHRRRLPQGGPLVRLLQPL